MTDEVHCMREVRTRLNACDQCGKCAGDAKRIIGEGIREKNTLRRYSTPEAA
jgi:bacterioferritin-associated ferredoxin